MMKIEITGHPLGPVEWRVLDDSGPVVGGIVATWRQACDDAHDALTAEVNRRPLTEGGR
jgi:hypothetical protein